MRLSNLVVAIVMAGAVGWVGGLIWFMNMTRRLAAPPPPAHSDGVVALTGGAGRVELALHVLMHGDADKLLLTGIGGGTDLATLGRLAGIDAKRLADRITLGRYAVSTRGNAVETAVWAEQNRINTLIVVTAAYHMPRALAELHRALPNVRLLPLPVMPRNAEDGPGLTMTAEEFTKYLISVSGLSMWLPPRETAYRSAVPTGSSG